MVQAFAFRAQAQAVIVCSCGENEMRAGFDIRVGPTDAASGQWEFHSETECRIGGRTIQEGSRKREVPLPKPEKWG